jgi:hypothetical protein
MREANRRKAIQSVCWAHLEVKGFADETQASRHLETIEFHFKLIRRAERKKGREKTTQRGRKLHFEEDFSPFNRMNAERAKKSLNNLHSIESAVLHPSEKSALLHSARPSALTSIHGNYFHAWLTALIGCSLRVSRLSAFLVSKAFRGEGKHFWGQQRKVASTPIKRARSWNSLIDVNFVGNSWGLQKKMLKARVLDAKSSTPTRASKHSRM